MLTGSGLSALRQSAVGDVGPQIVWRAEEPFTASPCNFSASAPPLQTLSGSMNVTSFESTSTSLSFADSWPFGAGASRIITIFRTGPQADGGTFLGWLQPPFQLEVTIPPPFTLHLLACEQMPKGVSRLRKDTSVLHTILTTVNSPPPSQQVRAKALVALRKAFAPSLGKCDELVCQFMCADRQSPQACTCASLTQCAPTNASMRITNEDWVLGHGTDARPTCLTNLNSADGSAGDHLGMSDCSVALQERQSFVFVPVPNSDLVTIRFRNSSGLCLSNFGAVFTPGQRLGLWQCNGFIDQSFRLKRQWNEFDIESARSFAPPSQLFCATVDPHRLDVDVLFQPCDGNLFSVQHFNAIPVSANLQR